MWLTSHMKRVSLYEAKANLSGLVKTVAEARQDYVVTVRGKPMVKIVPIEADGTARDVWAERERFVAEYGPPDFVAPEREYELPRDPFAE